VRLSKSKKEGGDREKLTRFGPGCFENPAEYPAVYGGGECGAGVRGMRSFSSLFKMPYGLPRGVLLNS